MLGSVRLWVVRLVLLATTGPPTPWLSLGSMFAQPVRSEPARAASDQSLLCQCLHTNTQSTQDCHEAAEICSLKPPHRLQRLLWNPLSKFSSPCWTRAGSCLPPVLSQTQINRIESDSRSDCLCTVEQVLKKLVGTNEEMEKSLEVLLSVHMMVDCLNHSHCQRCKDWYRSWFCLSKWPVYKGEKLLAPCPAECSQVQSSCPFLTIFEEASMAAGDPTFLCQDSSIVSTSDQDVIHKTCCYQLVSSSNECKSQSIVSVPVPREGEYVDLNTSCHHPLQVRECLGDFQSSSLTPVCDSARPATHISLANRTLIIRRSVSHLQTLASTSSDRPRATSITSIITYIYAVYSQFYS